jgi:adenylate cyclase
VAARRKELPRFAQALLTGAAVAVIAILNHFFGTLHALELKTRDARMKWTTPPKVSATGFDHPDLAIVTISEECIQWLEKENDRPWPWPREMFGFMFRALAMGKAKAILFDMFTHVDKDYLGTEAEWAKDIRNSPPSFVAAPFRIEKSEIADKRKDLDLLLQKFEVAVDADGSIDIPAPYASVVLPQPEIAGTVTGISDVSTPRDPEDGIIRSYRMLSRFRGKYYPSFALAALMVREGAKQVQVREGIMTVGKLSFPVDRKGALRLRFYQRWNAFQASDVVRGLWSIEDDKKVTSFDPKRVENRIVLIGTTAAALFDYKASPVGEIPGLEMHAIAIRNIIDREYLREVPVTVSLLLTAVLALITAHVTRFSSAAVGGIAAVGLLVGYGAVSVALFKAYWIINLMLPAVAIVLAYAATSAVNYLTEGRKRQQVKRMFGQYVSPKVVDKILQHGDALHLEGERKPFTIFFMDFAGFTAMSEKVDPSELVKLMSDYHNEAAEEIFATEGTVDKYIGDAIMAFWNDPVEQPDHPLRACLTAVGVQKRLVKMAQLMQERGLPAMSARIGLNTGIATVGNMGAKGQVNYTLMGDEVNLASRLEGVNKEFATKIIISEATYLPAKEKLEVRELALIKVKGKKLPVRIYELLGLKGEVPAGQLEAVRKFEAGLADLRARKFHQAWETFTSLAQKGDPTSRVYIDICERYMNEAPPADWDGSYQMEHK